MSSFEQSLQFKALQFLFYHQDVTYYNINHEASGFSCDFRLTDGSNLWMDSQAQIPATYRFSIENPDTNIHLVHDFLQALDIAQNDVLFLM